MDSNSIKEKITYCRFHRFLFNHMLDGLAELKVVFNEKGEAVDGIFIEVNKAFEKLTGLKRASIVGKRAGRVFPGIKNDPAGWLTKYKQAALAGKKFQFETFFPKLKKWFSVFGYVPEKGYLTVLFNDITWRLEAEKALHRNRRRFEVVFEKSRFAYYEHNTTGEFVMPRWPRLFGYKTEDINPFKDVEQWFKEKLHPGDRKKTETAYKRFIAKNAPYDLELRVKKRSGDFCWVRVINSVISRDGKGKPKRIGGFIFDITNQKQAEEARQEREAMLMEEQRKKLKDYAQELENYAQESERARAEDEALLSSIGEGVIAVNNEKKIVFANQEFLKIFKKSEKEIKDKEFTKVIHTCNKFGNPLPYKQRPMVVSMLTGKKVLKNYSDDLGYYAQVGDKLVPLTIASSPIILDGKTIGVIGVYRDMTREMEIDRAKNDFLSMAAHQLRTPLTTMSLSLEMILKGFIGKINKDIRNYLNDFSKDIGNMGRLIKDLLNVSRLDMANLELKIEPHNPAALVNDVIKNFTSQIEKKKIRIKKRYAARLPLVNTDEKLAAMCLENIISNAVNYTQPKEGLISVEIYKKDSRVVIKIADNGCGIPEKEQAKIFDKLYRASNVMPKSTGTGLGLYIAKYAAEKIKSKIWFNSQEGKGTTFYISLPAHKT